MSIFSRAWEITQAKINTILNKVENPNETLDLSYEKMVDGLQEVKAHLADVVTEQKRLEHKITALKDKLSTRDEEAKAALKLNQENLARQALELKQQENAQMVKLQSSLEHVSNQAAKLKAAEQKFQNRLSQFRDEKEVAKVNYTAAKAQAQVNESLSGAGKALGGVGKALDRAKEKTETMQARAEAIDSLTEEGILSDPLDTRDKVTKELDKVRQQSNVEDELAKLKSQLANDDK